MEQGWVYVLVNSSIPGLVKVGRTTRPPAERAVELSGATGVPTPFVIAFEQAFADCVEAEQAVHAELDRRRMRVAGNREFFRGAPAEIVRVILEVAAQSALVPATHAAPAAADLMAEGDRHLYGQGETMQDLAEALHYYRLAAARGSLLALERLGSIYGQLRKRGRAGRRRAMRYLKLGAKRGNYYCYCEMARLFAAERHTANFTKAWALFFAQRAQQRCAEVETGAPRYIAALHRYIAWCLDLDLVPVHMRELREAADILIPALTAALDRVRDAPEARARLSLVLRWAYQNLTPALPAPVRLPRRWRPFWADRPRRAMA